MEEHFLNARRAEVQLELLLYQSVPMEALRDSLLMIQSMQHDGVLTPEEVRFKNCVCVNLRLNCSTSGLKFYSTAERRIRRGPGASSEALGQS